MDPILHAHHLTKSIGSKLLFENFSFDIFDGNCIGILGPNGCGKTTLFNIISKREDLTSGDIDWKSNLTIRYLDQIPIRNTDTTIEDFFIRITQTNQIQQQIINLEQQLADPTIYNTLHYHEVLEQMRTLRMQMNKSSAVSQFETAHKLFKELDIDHFAFDTPIQPLSGGERQKIAIATVFSQIQPGNLILLDEPTNHLDIETIEWVEQKIANFSNTILLITHDQYLLNDLVDRIFEFQGIHLEIYDATFEEYEEQKQIRLHIKQQQYQRAAIEMKRQQTAIQEMTRKNRYSKQLTSRMKQFEKLKLPENPILKNYLLRFHFKTMIKSGKNIADGINLTKRFGDKTILQNGSFEILAEQKIGLIGPNGCGKTTFLKILMGEEALDQGTLHRSQGVKYGYFDQGHLSLNLDHTLLEEVLQNHSDLEENDAKALLGQLNFKGSIVTHKVEQLSGGERARLALLKLLMQPYNLLLLDEPTNHMDIDSKHAVETALNTYTGTTIIVSHDRKLLDAVCDTIFYMNQGIITIYSGNYTMFCQQRKKEITDQSGKDLAYLSQSGLTKYVVNKSFTIWSIKKKHNIGDIVFIGDHNRKLYEWAMKGGLLKESPSNK